MIIRREISSQHVGIRSLQKREPRKEWRGNEERGKDVERLALIERVSRKEEKNNKDWV
jgi:hypothetical protein